MSRRARASALLIIVLAVLTVLATGCARSVPGTAHAEGEGPEPAASPTAEAAPPTDFQEPSGRPTVTVQPDEAPLLGTPAPTSEAVVPRPSPGSGGPTGEPTSTPPQAAVPTGDGEGSTTDRAPAPARPTPGQGGSTPDRARAEPGGTGRSLTPPAPLTSDVVANECLLDAAQFADLLGGPVGAPAENEVTRSDGTRTRSCYATARSGSTTGAVNVYRVNQGTPASFVRAAAGGRPLPGVGEAAILLETVGGSALQIATPRYLVTVSVVDGTPTEARWAAAGRAVADAATRL